VWDYDKTDADDLCGTVTVDFDDLLNEMMPGAPTRYKNYFWANVYGAPMVGTSGNFENKMNADPRLASYWRGRVLLSLQVVENEKPKLCAQKINDPQLKKLVLEQFDSGAPFETRCQVFSGACLPCPGKQLKVMMRWGNQEAVTVLQNNTNGNCEWYENMKRKLINTPSDNIADLPDIFVYLMLEDTIVSYLRMRPAECTDVQGKAKWLQLIPDKSTKKAGEDWEGGFVRIRFYIGKYDEENDDLKIGGWATKPVKPAAGNKLLLVNLFQCRNLPAADPTGKADPYVKITCGATTVMTGKEEKMNNLNPVRDK